MHFFLTLFSYATLAASAPLSEGQVNAVNTYLDSLVEGIEPGLAVGIVFGSNVALERYVGYADLGHRIPIDSNSRFNIASNAKQFTALMALDLAAAGKIDLEKDFRQYLSSTLVNIDVPITVQQLISHTSGIRDIYDLWALTGVTWYERPFRVRDALSLLNRQSELNFAPGTDYRYSNSNYILLAALIAEVSGQRFEQYARTFFDRLGMPNTGLLRRYGVVVPNLARGYGNWSGWLETPMMANLHGDGFLYTTLKDQLSWEVQLQTRSSALQQSVVEQSQRPTHGTVESGYGFGVEFARYKGLETIVHEGSTGGYNAYLMRIPSRNLAIVVLGNTTQISVGAVAQQLADIVFGAAFAERANHPAGPDEWGIKPDMADLVGLYELESGTVVRIVEREGSLWREIEGTEPVMLMHERGQVYAYQTIPDLKLAFARDATGNASFTLYLATQAPQRATRVTEVPTQTTYLTGLNGVFRNAETDTEIVLEHQIEATFKLTKNGRQRDATLIGKDYLRMNSYKVRIRRGDDGAVSGLLVDNNRIGNVSFDRISP